MCDNKPKCWHKTGTDIT